ncbi:uncharacterized protein LOC144432615 isoform X2 [Glandiceps talaboti]
MDLRTSYYKDVDAAIVVVDLSDIESIELAGSWKQDILNHAVITKKRTVKDDTGAVAVVTDYIKADPKSIPVLLLGNKYDLVEEREKSKKEDTMEEKDEKEEGQDGEENDDVRDTNKRIQFADDSNEQEELEDSQQDSEHINSIDEKDKNLDSNRMDDVTKAMYEDEEYYRPQEVIIMEKIAEQHGFVGSVMVSAKDADGSVHTAIQSLLRHLIERKLKNKALEKMEMKQKRKVKRKRKAKPKIDDDFEEFQEVYIPEFDDLFHKCNLPVKKAQECNECYVDALKKFKTSCAEAGVVETPNASVEDCISGLKENIGEEEEFSFLAVDDSGFLELVVKGETQLKQPIRKALKTFHSEVVVACKTILRDCPKIDTILLSLDEHIVKITEKTWDLAIQHGQTHKDVHDTLHTVDENRARIKNARTIVSQRVQDVDNLYKKIKAAIMWSQRIDLIGSY